MSWSAPAKLSSGLRCSASQPEKRRAASREFVINVSIAAVGVIALLVLGFGRPRPVDPIPSVTASAMAGSIAAVAFHGSVVSLGGLVGIVKLFGITARNAILLVAHTNHIIEGEGAPWGLAIVLRATSEGLTPILMTAIVTA